MDLFRISKHQQRLILVGQFFLPRIIFLPRCACQSLICFCCIVLGPTSPLDGIDVFLQPLIDDLKRLWIGESTYDIARKENFRMRAALMWTINDY